MTASAPAFCSSVSLSMSCPYIYIFFSYIHSLQHLGNCRQFLPRKISITAPRHFLHLWFVLRVIALRWTLQPRVGDCSCSLTLHLCLRGGRPFFLPSLARELPKKSSLHTRDPASVVATARLNPFLHFNFGSADPGAMLSTAGAASSILLTGPGLVAPSTAFEAHDCATLLYPLQKWIPSSALPLSRGQRATSATYPWTHGSSPTQFFRRPGESLGPVWSGIRTLSLQ